MLGPILVVVAVVLVLPPAFLATGMLFSALLGWVATEDSAARHAGSELVDLNT